MPPQSTLQTPPQALSQAYTSPRRTPTTTAPSQTPGQASRFHPYPLHPHPTFAYKPLTYRQPAPSVSSTSSFAPSVASSSATVRQWPQHPQPGRSHSWSASEDRFSSSGAGSAVQAETVPPSALIWEEFYMQKEPGDELSAGEDYADGAGAEWGLGVDGQADDEAAGLPPLDAAASNAANDAALAEFFSIFSYASVADALPDAGSSVVVPLSAATVDGNFPGAEFLNIPDSATSADASMMPDLGDIDFSQFGFGLFDDYAASASAPDAEDGAGASGSGSSTSQVSPPEHSSSTSGATPLSLSFGTPIGSSPLVAGLAYARDNNLHHHADDDVSHTEKHAGDLGGLGGAAPGGAYAALPNGEAGGKKDINGVACSESTSLVGSSPPCPTLPRTTQHQHQLQSPASLHSHPQRTSNPTPGPTPTPAAVAAPPASQPHPPTPQQSRPALSSTAAPTAAGPAGVPATQDKPARYPHLRKIRMSTREKEVLYFQKEVLNVATAFYVDIASLFEKTPSDVIKRGMTRPGMGPDGESLEGVVNDIKDLVARLTVKASGLPESPPPPRRVALPRAPAPASAQTQARSQAHHRVISTGGSSAAEAIDLTAPTPSREASSSSERSPTPLVGSFPAARPAGLLLRAAAAPAVAGALGVSGVRRSLAPPVEVVVQASPSRKRKGTSDVPSPPRSPPPHTSPFAPPRQLIASTSTSAASSNLKPTSAPTPTPASTALAHLPSPSALPQPARILHGPWTPAEVERLKGLVALSAGTEDRAPKDHVDWTWVVTQFGSTRNRHQVLIKAVELGLRETSTHYSRRVKQKGYRESREDQEREKDRRSSSSGPPPAAPSTAAPSASRLLPSPMTRGPASSGASAGGSTDTGTGRSAGERGGANERARTGALAALVPRVGEASGSGSGSGAGRRDSEDSAPSDALHTPRGAMTPYAGPGHGAFSSPHHKTPYANVHSHAQAHAAHAHAPPRGQTQGHSRSHSLAELPSPRTPHTPHTPRTPRAPHTPTLPQAGPSALSPTASHPIPTPLGFGAYAYLPPPPHYISPETTRARRERERERAEAAERERRRLEVPAAPAGLISPLRREFAGPGAGAGGEAGRRQIEVIPGPSRRGEGADRPGLEAARERGSGGRGGLSGKRASV